MEELINKLSEEEKKAIEKFKTKIKRADKDILKFSDVYTTLDIHNLRILLNLIEKQQEQLQEKDKIIDLMAEQLAGLKNEVDILEQGNKDCFIPREYSDIDDCVKKESCKECIIEYFTKKAREV